MVKYTDTAITFEEVPDEISVCINISNCPNNCEGCHSSYLKEDIGDPLNEDAIDKIIDTTHGITCICFMGGDRDPEEVNRLANYVRNKSNLKICWYSGKQDLSDKIELKNFDYIKLGPYIPEKGPLNVKTTNQKLFAIQNEKMTDVTSRFWRV